MSANQRQDGGAPPAPRGSTPSPEQQPPRFRPSRAWILFALTLLAVNVYLGSRATQPPSRVRVPYSPFFLNQVTSGHVKEITSKGTAIQGMFTQKIRYGKAKPTTRFKTEVPAFANNDELSALLRKKGVVVNAQPLEGGVPWWENLLLGFGPTILFVFLLFWLMRRAGNVQNILGSFGRSRARRYQPSGDRVTFADVAGIDEAKAELSEMDDFDSSTNVIVVGATNRPDVLDPALLRPGRFDRRVAVQPPDRAGREAILRVHTRGVPLGPDVDLGRIAATTPGMVGADLANLVNEAALLAARRNHDAVAEADFTDALERIVLGAERQVMMTPEDRRRTAYHEAGHAIVGMLTDGADPVRKVSIIPRGLALGVTFAAPESDRFNYREPEVHAKIKVALGGRAAEEVVYGEASTGAESDIQQLTELARQMVGRWGMSEAIGPIAVLPRDGSGPLLPGVAEVSPATQKLVDDEVRRIVDQAHG